MTFTSSPPKPQPFFHSNNSGWTQPFTKNCLSRTISHNLPNNENPTPPTPNLTSSAVGIVRSSLCTPKGTGEGHRSNPVRRHPLKGWQQNRGCSSCRQRGYKFSMLWHDSRLQTTNIEVPWMRSVTSHKCKVLKEKLTCLLGHVDHQLAERKVVCRSDAHSLELTSCQAVRVTWSH